MRKNKLNILIVGNGNIAKLFKKSYFKNVNVSILSSKKIIKKKVKNINILIHAVGLNIYESLKNPKKAILFKKKINNNILNFVKQNNIKHIVYLSSIRVYSKNSSGVINEKSKCTNVQAYASAHLITEKLLKQKSSDSLKITILRLSNVFGINYKDKSTKYGVHRMIETGLNEKKIYVDDKFAKINLIHISYFIKIFTKLILHKSKFKIINVVQKDYKLIYLARIIAKRINKLFNFTPAILVQQKKYKTENFTIKSLYYKPISNRLLLFKQIDKCFYFLK